MPNQSATLSAPDTCLALHAGTARELMTPNPLSIHDTATAQDAADFLYTHHISGAPVIDVAGRPVGVITMTDLVWFQRAKDGHFPTQHEIYYRDAPAKTRPVSASARLARELMTPAVFSVRPETPVRQVLEEMYRSKVHRLFVVDGDGTLIGVVAAFDVIRDLCE
ncbi:MAG TPA: CBS domain-containing protein [Planctomycetota bacterium]|nr:CBS domain-containing protein [Planctomycetota bacterium]